MYRQNILTREFGPSRSAAGRRAAALVLSRPLARAIPEAQVVVAPRSPSPTSVRDGLFEQRARSAETLSTKYLPADQSTVGALVRGQEQLVFKSFRRNGVESSVRVVARFCPAPVDEEIPGVAAAPRAFVTHPDAPVIESSDRAYSFELDGVFGEEALQAQVYEDVGRPAVSDVLCGYNGAVLAYGQTGSGKTHCMFGPNLQEPECHGVVPRAARQVFDAIRADTEGVEFVLRCSLLEVYCEQLRDLLNPANRHLRVKELPGRGVFVDGLVQEFVVCESDILDIIRTGNKMRAVARTRLNQHSSRSHVVFMLTFEQKMPDGTEKVGKLCLADLAGSERVRRSGALEAGGVSLEEARNINRSLSALGNTILALAEKRPHVPYRDSRLTRVLQETLGGNCKTTLVVTCSSGVAHTEETLSTLHFATRARSVRNHVKVNFIHSAEQLTSLAERLQRELTATRREAARLLAMTPAPLDTPFGTREFHSSARPEGARQGPARGVVAAAGPPAEDRVAALAAALEAQEGCFWKAHEQFSAALQWGARHVASDEWSLKERLHSQRWRLVLAQHAKTVAEACVAASEVQTGRLEEELTGVQEQVRTQQLLAHRCEVLEIRGWWASAAQAGGFGTPQPGRGAPMDRSVGSGVAAPGSVGWSPRVRPRPRQDYLSPGLRGSKVVRRICRRDVERLSGAAPSPTSVGDDREVGSISVLTVGESEVDGELDMSGWLCCGSVGSAADSFASPSAPNKPCSTGIISTPRVRGGRGISVSVSPRLALGAQRSPQGHGNRADGVRRACDTPSTDEEQRLLARVDAACAELLCERRAFEETFDHQQAEFRRRMATMTEHIAELQQSHLRSQGQSTRLRQELEAAHLAIEATVGERDALDLRLLSLRRSAASLQGWAEVRRPPALGSAAFEAALRGAAATMARCLEASEAMRGNCAGKENQSPGQRAGSCQRPLRCCGEVWAPGRA